MSSLFASAISASVSAHAAAATTTAAPVISGVSHSQAMYFVADCFVLNLGVHRNIVESMANVETAANALKWLRFQAIMKGL
jgi:hypothetical protein